MSWLVIAAIGLVTYCLRASFLVGRKQGQGERLRRSLRYVPVAVLPPLAVSAVIRHGGGSLDLRVAAAALALLVAWRTGNAAASMAAGMLMLWSLLYL